MSSVLRDAAGDGVSPAPASAGGAGASAGSADAQVPTGHLVRCPHCRALNGRSVSTCWNCESDLYTLLQPGADLLPEALAAAQDSDTAPTRDRGGTAAPPRRAPASAPGALDLSVLLGETAAAARAPAARPSDPPVARPTIGPGLVGAARAAATASAMASASAIPAASTRGPRPHWGLAAAVLVGVLFVAGGAAYEFFSTGAPAGERPALRDPASAGRPPAAGGPALGTAAAPSDGLSRVDEALRAADAAAAASPPPDELSLPQEPPAPPRSRKAGAGHHAKSRQPAATVDAVVP